MPLRKNSKPSAEDLFRFGYSLDRSGLRKVADSLYSKAIRFLESESTEDIAQIERMPTFSLELSARALAHGENLYHLGRIEEARAAFAEAARNCEALINCDASFLVMAQLACASQWLAHCHHLANEQLIAKKLYDRAIALYRQLLAYSRPSRTLRRSYRRALELSIHSRKRLYTTPEGEPAE